MYPFIVEIWGCEIQVQFPLSLFNEKKVDLVQQRNSPHLCFTQLILLLDHFESLQLSLPRFTRPPSPCSCSHVPIDAAEHKTRSSTPLLPHPCTDQAPAIHPSDSAAGSLDPDHCSPAEQREAREGDKGGAGWGVWRATGRTTRSGRRPGWHVSPFLVRRSWRAFYTHVSTSHAHLHVVVRRNTLIATRRRPIRLSSKPGYRVARFKGRTKVLSITLRSYGGACALRRLERKNKETGTGRDRFDNPAQRHSMEARRITRNCMNPVACV